MGFRWLHRRAAHWHGAARGRGGLARAAVLATRLAAVQTPLLRADLAAVERGRRQLLNQREVGEEVAVAAGAEAAVKDYFFSFRDYQDLMLFHPKFGYYSSGAASFVGDWSTYPVVLAPYFGQMIAEQIFRMWSGMRQAGTLEAGEPFTIAEFGAGDGALAESILDYSGTTLRSKRSMPAMIARRPSVRRSASGMPILENASRRAWEMRATPPAQSPLAA